MRSFKVLKNIVDATVPLNIETFGRVSNQTKKEI